jgi:uncharacterized protein (TIGR02594 family)
MVTVPKWLIIALGDADVKEIPGADNNPRIVAMAATCTLKARDDETPWCSEAVNTWITEAGYEGTNSAAAVSWADWGHELEEGTLGCVVVICNSAGQHHVGLYLGEDNDGVFVWGGNQSNRVCVAHFPWEYVTNFRMIEEG